MYKYITEAVLYNSYGRELDRQSVSDRDISGSVANILSSWKLSEGYTIKIESRMIKYY